VTAPLVPPVTRFIDQARVDAYADAAPDPNPIHRETPEAYGGPFGRPIAHGMLLVALASEAMSATFGEAWGATGTMKVRWRQPALPPVTVTASATLASEAEGTATYEVACATADGEVLLVGTASVRYA
jgi:3-hydroxybutyryl-CoA dehydratase